MFSPQRQREELAKFLNEQVAFKQELIRQLAQAQLDKIHAFQQEHTSEDIDRYIADHLYDLELLAQKAIQDTCKKVIPGWNLIYILKHIGLFAVVLLPSVHILLELLSSEGQQISQVEIIIALVLLACLFTASAGALIFESYRKQ